MTTQTPPPPVTVAWCRNCQWYLERRVPLAGERCPECGWRLIARRGYIDEDDELQMFYPTKKGYLGREGTV
jgi:hypothetical protein